MPIYFVHLHHLALDCDAAKEIVNLKGNRSKAKRGDKCVQHKCIIDWLNCQLLHIDIYNLVSQQIR